MENHKSKSMTKNNRERQYIIDLQKHRSFIALLASLISLFFAIYAITSGLILYARHGESPIELYRYFTIVSNSITAFGTSMIIPYAIEGFRKKRFYCPKWALLFYYSGTVCTTLVMFFAVFIISRVDAKNAFEGYNFYLHVICPLMILVSFLLIESYYKLTVMDAVCAIVPIAIYAAVYIYKVIIVGADAGGWDDIYYFNTFAPAVVSLLAMMTISFLLALALKHIYSKLNVMRMNKLKERLWSEGTSLVEIKIEFFGLGRYFGRKEYNSYATLPLDIISIVSDRYNIKKEELIRAFIKGLLDKINEKSDK